MASGGQDDGVHEYGTDDGEYEDFYDEDDGENAGGTTAKPVVKSEADVKPVVKAKGVTTRSRAKQQAEWEVDLRKSSKLLAETRAEMARLRRQVSREEKRTGEHGKPTSEKLMPMKYAGSTDFEEYLVQFEIIAGLHEWSSDRKAAVLMAKLEGAALSVASPVAGKGYDALTTKLRERFSPEQQEAFALRLKTKMQGRGESYEALADEVRMLTKKAYPESDEKTKDRLAKDAFVGAVLDDKVREKRRDQAPSSMEDALKLARQLSASRELERRRVRMVTDVEPVAVENDENVS